MSTVAATVRSRLDRARPGAFLRTSDFAGSRAAVETQLSRRAGSGGDLLRVRRGLYWKGVSSRFGPGRPGVDAVVREVASDVGVGPAGWSAGRALGLSTQVPATPLYAVVGPPPTGIPGASFCSRRNLARLGLRYHEVALLEVLRDWPRFVEADWPALVAKVAGLRDAGLVRLERVARTAGAERRPALRRRMEALVADLAARPDPSAPGGT